MGVTLGDDVKPDRAIVAEVGDDTPFADCYAELTSTLESADFALTDVNHLMEKDIPQAEERLADARKFVDECSDLVNSLELEMQSLSEPQRNKIRAVVLRARDKVTNHRKRLRTTGMELQSAKDAEARARLLDADNSADIEAIRERMREADAAADLEAGSQSVADSKRAVGDTEVIADSILQDLQSQRVSLTGARNDVSANDSGIEESIGLISSMQQRSCSNRVVVYAFGAILVFICIVIIYSRLFHRRVVVTGVRLNGGEFYGGWR